MEMIKACNLKKSFGNLEVIKDISFNVNKGDIIAVLGPSGSGKSTLLRSLIDLEKLDFGSVCIEGEFLCKDGIYPDEKKIKKVCGKMGMVFQHFNLFPHMTVKQNLMCAPLINKLNNKEELLERCKQLLDKVGLIDKMDERPSVLSGGQKQRVAIARALMLNPDILLFDEPTSALDPELTKEVLNVIQNLANEKMTMMIVTHEMHFAREAANRVIFMDNGFIVQEGSPQDVLDNSENLRVQNFLKHVF